MNKRIPEKFAEPIQVGRPNIGNTGNLMARIEKMLDNRWFSNNGPLVQEFEYKLARFVNVKHCIAVCNATVGLEIAARALDLRGEVIVPAYTFIATAHALRWQHVTPVFADMDPFTHNIDPKCIESLITSRTTGIVGTHVWGRPCSVEAIQEIAERRGLKVMYDAAHAFACSHKGIMVGNFGDCEVFSFHATKFINSFEGGAIVTNCDTLADQIRIMRNFGFAGVDNVVAVGTNGKMSEVHAAMGITSLEAIDEIVAINRRNYKLYKGLIDRLDGLSVVAYDESEMNNYQYIVVQIDPGVCRVSRNDIVNFLHKNNVIARKYFWPGVHQMPVYRLERRLKRENLRNTEIGSELIFVLPSGQSLDPDSIVRICDILSFAVSDNAHQC